MLLSAASILAGVVSFLTLWGLIPRNEWWIRFCDFPRLQFLVLGVVAAIGMLLSVFSFEGWHWALFILLLGCLLYQSYMIVPYTSLWKQRVRHANDPKPETTLTLMVSNVLTPNEDKHKLIKLVNQHQPDILITLESDASWQQATDALGYEYSVCVPLDNLYGMHLYSRLELINPEVKYLMIEDIPSIHTQVRLDNGQVFWLYCLHPMPPSPTEAKSASPRDAELLLVGETISQRQEPAILAGDLNDVAWSKTTRAFVRVSGLDDPRVGRFFINTFHVKYPLLRWALDHIFVSNEFAYLDMMRLPSIGSDHFPVLSTLHFEPATNTTDKSVTPQVNQQEQQDIDDKIQEGEAAAQEEEVALKERTQDRLQD